MEFLLSLISLEKITALPVILSGPGLLIILLFLVRFVRSLFTLHLITAASSLLFAFVVALVLSQWGEDIAEMLDINDPSQLSSLQLLPDSANQRLAQFAGVGSIEMHPIQG